MKIPVGHVIRRYLTLTETFIQSFLTHAEAHSPLVLTDILHRHTADQTPCVYLVEDGEFTQMSSADRRFFLSELNYPTCFASMVRERNLALLHAHFGMTGYRALPLKKQTGCPLVASFYGIDASKMLLQKSSLKRFVRLFDQADALVALGANMVDRLVAAGCPRHKLHIVHLGVDLERIEMLERRTDRAQCVLLYCGRLVHKKGIFDALHAFAQIADQWPDLVFRVVGDGPLRTPLRRAVRQLGLQGRVRILGALSHTRVLNEMARADLFVLPSRTADDGDMEGTPTVLLEAQASGLPVVSTFHADIPEVVRDGESGFLVAEGDVDGLAEKFALLLEHPDWWRDFGTCGRAHVMNHYNILKEIVKLESLYRDVSGV